MSNVPSRRFATIATLALVLAAILSSGEAIVCYQCNSEYDPRCGDPFDDFSLGTVNCSLQPRLEHLEHLEPTICRKISQKVYGQTRVVRGCGFITDDSSDKDCLMRTGTHDVRVLYCACTTDLCNAAHKDVLPSIFTTLIVTIVLTWKLI